MLDLYLYLIQEQNVQPVGTEVKRVPKCPEGFRW